MPEKRTAQAFVPIQDIRGNVIVQRNGQFSMVLLASSINFALKSDAEQEAVLSQFQSFLNTLDFSLQIYVKSRRLNIEPYLSKLDKLESIQDNDLMRIQLREYIEFIKVFTSNVDVMRKNFFVVVPYSPVPFKIGSSINKLFSLHKSSSYVGSASNTLKEERFEEIRTQLEQRASLVAEGLARCGVKTIVLEKDDLVDLFYHVYNPIDLTGSPLPYGNNNQ